MITYQIETYASTQEEVKAITQAHWDEVPFGPWHDIGLDVDHNQYLLIEAMGSMRIYTARDDGKIIGYLVILASAMLHNKNIWRATDDVVYVAPEYRGSPVFQTLIDMAIKDCKDAGVHFFTLSVNPNYDFSKVLLKQGFVHTESAYTVRL